MKEYNQVTLTVKTSLRKLDLTPMSLPFLWRFIKLSHKVKYTPNAKFQNQ